MKEIDLFNHEIFFHQSMIRKLMNQFAFFSSLLGINQQSAPKSPILSVSIVQCSAVSVTYPLCAVLSAVNIALYLVHMKPDFLFSFPCLLNSLFESISKCPVCIQLSFPNFVKNKTRELFCTFQL